jgi:hypothetical protein
MKKTANILVVIIITVLFASCDKAKVDIDFNLDIANIYFTIDTTSVTGDVQLATTTFNSTLQQELDNNDATLDDVQSIEITGVEFIHLNPQNFDIVEKAYAHLSASGLPEVRIAYKDPVPDGLTLLPMNLDAVDLKSYLSQSVVTFRATGFLSAPNVQADSLQVKLSFKVRAEVKP